jgi:quercetin dioxygenase-like cupin family protein
MHKTETIDYIILLKGDITLILDEEEVDLKPFDVVVQRGTNHAWVNNGNEPALLIAVLVDSNVI